MCLDHVLERSQFVVLKYIKPKKKRHIPDKHPTKRSPTYRDSDKDRDTGAEAGMATVRRHDDELNHTTTLVGQGLKVQSR